MARRTKKNRSEQGYWHWLVLGVFAVFFILLAYNTLVHFARAAEVFKVKEIVLSPSVKFMETGVLSQLRGMSIFEVDLPSVQRRLMAEYPQVDQIRVYRRLPDRIYIMARKRDPMALLAVHGREVVVDEEGVVLPKVGEPDFRLPLIRGANEARIPDAGQRAYGVDVQAALMIIRSFQENARLKPFQIVTLNVENLSRMTMTLSNDMTVLLDRDDMARQIRALGVVLSQGTVKFDDVRYIDLRFREPILGKKGQ